MKFVIRFVGFMGLLVMSISNAQVYKCTINGDEYYQDRPCKREVSSPASANAVFDGWRYGMHISEMKRVAFQRNLSLAPGASPAYKGYSSKIVNRQPEARRYTYKTELMGTLAHVSLYFTKASRVLYKIDSRLVMSSTPASERKYFYSALYEKLSAKYGKAVLIDTEQVRQTAKNGPIGNLFSSSIQRVFVGQLQAWGLKTDNVVTLSYKPKYELMTSYQLSYQSRTLKKRNEAEVGADEKLRVNKAMSIDADKL